MDTFEKLIKREASVGEKACFRRLFHEAYSMVASEMKLSVGKVEDTSSRKLSQPERAERYESQKRKLSGVNIRGPNEPADSLVDAACALYEENRLRWIAWSSCVSKEQELMGDKKDTAFSLSGNVLKLEAKSADVVADTSNEILLQYALTRRALAMDQANLLDFTVMQKWTEKLVRARVEPPPPGFQKPSVRQLMAADVKLFEEIADQTRAGIQAVASGRPLDDVLPKVMIMTEVCSLMQPLPAHVSTGGGPPGDKPDRPPKLHNLYGPYAKGKGKGKGEGKGKPFVRMPVPLIGCNAQTARGDPICFSFNLENCTERVDRGRCSKGLHVCCAPKCGGHHAAIKCDKRPKKDQ